MNTGIGNNLWVSVITGGLAGAVASFVMNRFFEIIQILQATKGITIEPEKIPSGSRIRVCNNYTRNIEDAVAYISINHNVDDIFHGEAFIGPHHLVQLNEDRLCWAFAGPEKHPFKINIYPGEKQALDVFVFDENKIEIPSEQGWSSQTPGKKSRVFLRKANYEGKICIVGKNILRREFDIYICPFCDDYHLKIVKTKSISIMDIIRLQ